MPASKYLLHRKEEVMALAELSRICSNNSVKALTFLRETLGILLLLLLHKTHVRNALCCMHLSLALMDRCIPELWLSFWSEVHYNSLYEADGKSQCLDPLYFLLHVDILHESETKVFTWQIFQHGHQKESTGSFRGGVPVLFCCGV